MPEGKQMSSTTVAGTWHLVFFAVTDTAGEALWYPMGENPCGLLIYTDDGWMSVHLSKKDRPHFSVNHQRAGTFAEKSDAMETYFSYGGRYEVVGTRIVHHISISSFPNWTGADQWRDAECDGDRLTLRSAPGTGDDGRTTRSTLIWERTTPEPS